MDGKEKQMINYSTRDFEFAHGKKPTGLGYWAFIFDGNRSVEPFWFYGKYSAAKVAALKKAKELGAEDVEVGS
jgi:hypothetical protein